MSKIKLFSGMDFSGKSTIIKLTNKILPNTFRCQEKFLTSIDTLNKMIANNIWLPPREEFIPLLLELLEKDTSNYVEQVPLLQDTLWAIKFVAKLCLDTENDYDKEINELMTLISRYPKADSYYLTTTMNERIKRYEMRVISGKRISKSDTLVFSPNTFVEIEKRYQQIIFELFPDTRIIDTSFDSPEMIVCQLLSDKKFLSDL